MNLRKGRSVSCFFCQWTLRNFFLLISRFSKDSLFIFIAFCWFAWRKVTECNMCCSDIGTGMTQRSQDFTMDHTTQVQAQCYSTLSECRHSAGTTSSCKGASLIMPTACSTASTRLGSVLVRGILLMSRSLFLSFSTYPNFLRTGFTLISASPSVERRYIVLSVSQFIIQNWRGKKSH